MRTKKKKERTKEPSFCTIKWELKYKKACHAVQKGVYYKRKMGEYMAAQLPENDINYIKSNVLIASKYKGTLLENKILAYALSQVKERDIGDQDVEYTFTAAELRNVTGSTSGSFYTKLTPVAKALVGRVIGYEDPEKKEFEYIPLIQKATYVDGEFTITFNRELKKYISDINTNYTRLNLQTMMNFRSDYSFRLYELLKRHCYHPKGSPYTSDIYTITYGISELKFIIGVVDANDPAAKNYLSKIHNPTNKDYNEAILKAKRDTSYDDWTALRRRVIDPAVKEICEKTEVFVQYETKRSGRGGKIDAITFTMQILQPAKATKDSKDLTEEQKGEVIDVILELLTESGLPIRLKDATKLAERGKYDLYLIRKAFMIYQAAGGKIEDPIAYLIAAIDRNFVPSRSQLAASKEKGIIQVEGEQVEVDFTQMALPFEVPDDEEEE